MNESTPLSEFTLAELYFLKDAIIKEKPISDWERVNVKEKILSIIKIAIKNQEQ